MKVLNRIGIAAGFSILLLSGIVIAEGAASQVNLAKSVTVISIDDSELLTFDENGVVTNLGYPNVMSNLPLEVVLTPLEAQRALREVLKVMPKLSNGTNVGFLHHMPISKRASTHIAAGAFMRSGEEGEGSETDKSVDPMLQFGLTYKLNQDLFVTGEIQRYFRSEYDDIERYAVGVIYNF